MTEPILDTLTQRLDRMEREVRWWKCLGTIATGALIAILLAGATADTVADQIRTKRLVIIDSGGKERVVLGEDLVRGIGLQILGGDGTTRIELMVKHLLEDRPFMHFRGKDPGWVVFLVEQGGDGAPKLQLLRPRVGDKPLMGGGGPNVARAELRLQFDGSPSFTFRTDDGKVIWKAP